METTVTLGFMRSYAIGHLLMAVAMGISTYGASYDAFDEGHVSQWVDFIASIAVTILLAAWGAGGIRATYLLRRQIQ